MRRLVALTIMATTLGSSPVAAAEPSFSDYPAKVYAGPTVAPAFRGEQRPYAAYRTRIRQSLGRGVRFGGHYAMAIIGCGAGCRFGYVTDLKTGLVYDLPLGGDDYPVVSYRARPDSRLLRAQWEVYAEDGGDPGCGRQDFVWTGKAFRALGAPQITPDACPPWDDAA